MSFQGLKFISISYNSHKIGLDLVLVKLLLAEDDLQDVANTEEKVFDFFRNNCSTRLDNIWHHVANVILDI